MTLGVACLWRPVMTHPKKMSSFNVLLLFLVILQCSSFASCRWCTKLRAETTVQQLTEPGECKQAYHAACGWFSSSQCTYYETLPCLKERNHTVVQYKIVSECCAGYTLNPVNNMTCIRTSGPRERHVYYYTSDGGFLLGLSPGAYAGIICSLVFVFCVIVVITVRVIKRKQRNLKTKEVKVTDMETSKKMINPTRV